MANEVASKEGSEGKPNGNGEYNEFALLKEDAISKWSQQLGLHEASIKVYSTLPFLVQPIMNKWETQDERGYELKVLARTSFFRFDQLPPEVRNMIYANVLDGPLIRIILNTAAIRRGEEAKACVMKDTVFRSGKTAAIFLANKAMSIEARAWFYSSRIFEFQNLTACKRLLETIGNNRAQLRYITISRVTTGGQASFATLLRLLKDTKKLEKLTLLTHDARNLMRAILGCSKRTDLGKSTHLMLPFSQFLARLDSVRDTPDEAKRIVTLDSDHYRRVDENKWIFSWFEDEMMKQVKAEVEKQKTN